MIGQRNRNNSPANALPAGGRHDGRCALLVQQTIADPHVGRRDQFGSHGHCLHRAINTGTVTSLLGFIPSSIAYHGWSPPPPGWCCHPASTTKPDRARRPGSRPFDAANLAVGPTSPSITGSRSGWNRQFGRARPSTSEAPTPCGDTAGSRARTRNVLAVGHIPTMRYSVAGPSAGLQRCRSRRGDVRSR
jgi:hypothetical protein